MGTLLLSVHRRILCFYSQWSVPFAGAALAPTDFTTMQCLRIVSHNVETGQRIRNTRIPIAVVKVAARFLPASLLAKVDERLTQQIARDILDAVPRMIDEVAQQPIEPESGVPGLIAEEEARRGGKYDRVPVPEGSQQREEWTERTLVYIE